MTFSHPIEPSNVRTNVGVSISRRQMMVRSAATIAAGTALLDELAHAQVGSTTQPTGDYTPVVTPNGATLPWKMIDGVKVFHLVAEPVKHEMAPGLVVETWGYNGRCHGPTIEAVEGDRCRFYVTNRLPEPTTIHWHGVLLPNGMDGVSGLTQPPIPVGETFMYEFTFKQHGTLMYHSHFDEMVQIAMGLVGMIVVHPKSRDPSRARVDRDFAIMLLEWAIHPGASRPDPMEMTDFNMLTMNAKAFPGTAPPVVKVGQRVRIRLGNLGPMDHHPIHLHGYNFRITGSDGGDAPESSQAPETTVLVPVGATRDIEFVADAPGDWAMHCHMTHHTMNQMGHGLPNMIGVNTQGLDEKIRKLLPDYMSMGKTGMGDMAEHMGHMPVPANSIPMLGAKGPFGQIEMGGMFTILKVREHLTSYDDPGWYDHPPGTVASRVDPSEVERIFGAAGAPATQPLAYTCPMHPEVVSSEPGTCPKCRMKLKPRS